MPPNLQNSDHYKTGKGQFSFQSQRKAMPTKCSNYHTIALISHASKVTLKILQARLQQYMNQELSDYKLDLWKAEAEIKLPTFTGSQKKQGNSRKTSISASLTMLNPFTVWITTNWKILKEKGLSCNTCLYIFEISCLSVASFAIIFSHSGGMVGGGFRMGNTCTPMADSCWCMAKPIQYCKVISLQLK